MKLWQAATRRVEAQNRPGWPSIMRAALDRDTPTLTSAEAQAMRATVVSAARDGGTRRMWRRPLAIAATVLLILGAGAAAGRRSDSRQPTASGPVEPPPPAVNEQLQLQFATPGGTRIIWVFNPELDLKALMP
jgi:hypothetical protein